MIYFKSTLVGILGSIIAIVIVILASLRVLYGEGSGAASMSIASGQILAAGLTGFAIGFWLTLRRGRATSRVLSGDS